MKEIQLTQGKKALIDDQDFKAISCLKWAFHRNSRSKFQTKGYAVCKTRPYGGKKMVTIFMHRFILNPPQEMHVDHINGDGLDNRRSNLRICTREENAKFGAERRAKENGFYREFHPMTKGEGA